MDYPNRPLSSLYHAVLLAYLGARHRKRGSKHFGKRKTFNDIFLLGLDLDCVLIDQKLFGIKLLNIVLRSSTNHNSIYASRPLGLDTTRKTTLKWHVCHLGAEGGEPNVTSHEHCSLSGLA